VNAKGGRGKGRIEKAEPHHFRKYLLPIFGCRIKIQKGDFGRGNALGHEPAIGLIPSTPFKKASMEYLKKAPPTSAGDRLAIQNTVSMIVGPGAAAGNAELAPTMAAIAEAENTKGHALTAQMRIDKESNVFD
jgi:hypothetical protein